MLLHSARLGPIAKFQRGRRRCYAEGGRRESFGLHSFRGHKRNVSYSDSSSVSKCGEMKHPRLGYGGTLPNRIPESDTSQRATLVDPANEHNPATLLVAIAAHLVDGVLVNVEELRPSPSRGDTTRAVVCTERADDMDVCAQRQIIGDHATTPNFAALFIFIMKGIVTILPISVFNLSSTRSCII